MLNTIMPGQLTSLIIRIKFPHLINYYSKKSLKFSLQISEKIEKIKIENGKFSFPSFFQYENFGIVLSNIG